MRARARSRASGRSRDAERGRRLREGASREERSRDTVPSRGAGLRGDERGRRLDAIGALGRSVGGRICARQRRASASGVSSQTLRLTQLEAGVISRAWDEEKERAASSASSRPRCALVRPRRGESGLQSHSFSREDAHHRKQLQRLLAELRKVELPAPLGEDAVGVDEEPTLERAPPGLVEQGATALRVAEVAELLLVDVEHARRAFAVGRAGVRRAERGRVEVHLRARAASGRI